ncbi:hypothetical protein [Aquipluma nitroreducens]|nr:hypothetical protein [Aquipluma nitroreducens]
MGHPFSKFIPVKSGLPVAVFEKCGKQEACPSKNNRYQNGYTRFDSIYKSLYFFQNSIESGQILLLNSFYCCIAPGGTSRLNSANFLAIDKLAK